MKPKKRRIFTADGAEMILNIPAEQPGRKRFASEEERRRHHNEIRKAMRARRRLYGNYGLESCFKTVINPHERIIRERIEGYVNALRNTTGPDMRESEIPNRKEWTERLLSHGSAQGKPVLLGKLLRGYPSDIEH